MQANGESPEAYKSTLEKDLMLFQSRAHEMLGVTPTALVYPYGAYNKASEEVAKSLGFKATLTCTEGMNYITRDSESLYSLKRFLRDSKTGVSDILKK